MFNFIKRHIKNSRITYLEGRILGLQQHISRVEQKLECYTKQYHKFNVLENREKGTKFLHCTICGYEKPYLVYADGKVIEVKDDLLK